MYRFNRYNKRVLASQKALAIIAIFLIMLGCSPGPSEESVNYYRSHEKERIEIVQSGNSRQKDWLAATQAHRELQHEEAVKLTKGK